MHRFLFCITLFCLTVSGSLYMDYVQCVEQRQCGLSSVCSFVLTPPAGSVNKTDIKGYIMRISNGLSKPINLTWDILGTSRCLNMSNLTSMKTTFTLEDHNSRFINTHCNDIHTIRLQVSNETTDTEIANPEFLCTSDEACEYLVRSCFANNDDPLCKDYSSYCHTALKYTSSNMDTFKQSCIPNCISEFYSGETTDPYRYNSDDEMEKLSRYYNLAVNNPDKSATGLPVGVTITIVLGVAVLVILIAVGIFIYVRRRRNRIGHM